MMMNHLSLPRVQSGFGLLFPAVRAKHNFAKFKDSLEYVRLKVVDDSLWVEINRPQVHNALHPGLMAELFQVFGPFQHTPVKHEHLGGESHHAHGCFHPSQAPLPPLPHPHPRVHENAYIPPSGIRSIVLTGNGNSFCAGADIKWMKETAESTFAESRSSADLLYSVLTSMRHCNVPIIGRVNGAGMGGGSGLIAACDITLAVKKAKFGFPEAKLGLIPAVIAPFVIGRIGFSSASRYYLTAEKFDAVIGKKIGLINEVCETIEDLDKEVNRIVKLIQITSPKSSCAIKQLLHHVTSHSNDYQNPDIRDYLTDKFATMKIGEDAKEGFTSFLENRKPVWGVH